MLRFVLESSRTYLKSEATAHISELQMLVSRQFSATSLYIYIDALISPMPRLSLDSGLRTCRIALVAILAFSEEAKRNPLDIVEGLEAQYPSAAVYAHCIVIILVLPEGRVTCSASILKRKDLCLGCTDSCLIGQILSGL